RSALPDGYVDDAEIAFLIAVLGESAAGVISTAVAWRPRLRRRMAEPAGSAPARDGAASCPACVGPGAQIAHPARASPRRWRLLRRTGAPARVRRWKTRPPHPPENRNPWPGPGRAPRCPSL